MGKGRLNPLKPFQERLRRGYHSIRGFKLFPLPSLVEMPSWTLYHSGLGPPSLVFMIRPFVH